MPERDRQAVVAWFRLLVEGGGDEFGFEPAEGSWRIVEGGVVGAAAVHAVPYLVRLIVAGVEVETLVRVLTEVAAADHGGRAREAVLAGLPEVLRLAGEADAETRKVVVGACPAFGAPGTVLPVLRERWSAEAEPLVRAAVLAALAEVRPNEGTALAFEVITERAVADLAVRARAVVVAMGAGESWTPELAHVLLGDYENDPHQFCAVVAELCRRDSWEDACALVVEAVKRGAADAPSRGALFATVEKLCGTFRSAPALLLPSLIVMLGWDDFPLDSRSWTRGTERVVELIGDLGPLGAPAGDTIVAGLHGLGSLDYAITALVKIGDGRAARLLARHLPECPDAVFAAREHGLPCDPVLLEAIRAQLRDPVDYHYQRQECLLDLLRSWGPDAHAATPEVYAAWRDHHEVQDLLAVLPVEPQERALAVEALQEALVTGRRNTRIHAAAALFRLTGDAGPALTELTAVFQKRPGTLRGMVAAQACLELGEAARPLLPLLLAVLDRSIAKAEDEIRPALLATAVWRLTGDPEPVLPVLRRAVRGIFFDRFTALELVREMGPAARPLAGLLARRVGKRSYALPEFVRALRAAVPEEADRPRGRTDRKLAGALLRSLFNDPYGIENKLSALSEIGVHRLSPKAHARLMKYAHAERRPRESRKVSVDEAVRAACREMLLDPGAAS